VENLGVIFAVVPDPRAGNARHDLTDVLAIAFAATLCGAETCCDMALFGRSKERLLREMLPLAHGIPSHDTFSRVFRLIDPEAFEAAFRRFAAAFAERLGGQAGLAGQVVAIDGKSLSGAFEAGARATPLHLVTAWAADQRLVLAQRRAPGRSETTAALEVVAMLDLLGATVTADALHGSRRMAAAIRARGGDYALAIKGNRGPLHRAMRDLLEGADPATGARTSEVAHGREENRQAVVLPVPPDWPDRFGFTGLAAVARIDAVRRIGGAEQRQSRYFALSSEISPVQALRIVRAHWTIENGQHWVLDVVMDEDRARSRKDNAAENIALLRRLALNLLRTDAEKTSIRAKIKKAGWHDQYLLNLLGQMR
jgi:predicted transposase YbfD/YdcC